MPKAPFRYLHPKRRTGLPKTFVCTPLPSLGRISSSPSTISPKPERPAHPRSPSHPQEMAGRLLAAALALSASATAGTAYYILSDGGDAAVAQRRVDSAIAVVRDASETPATPALAKTDARAAPTSTEVGSAGDAQSDVRSAATDEGYRGCHSCSGPRLWFYADKLGVTRLKRRIGPEADI